MGTPVDAADLLDEAGFVDLREDFAEVAIPFPNTETLWRWSMTHGYRPSSRICRTAVAPSSTTECWRCERRISSCAGSAACGRVASLPSGDPEGDAKAVTADRAARRICGRLG